MAKVIHIEPKNREEATSQSSLLEEPARLAPRTGAEASQELARRETRSGLAQTTYPGTLAGTQNRAQINVLTLEARREQRKQQAFLAVYGTEGANRQYLDFSLGFTALLSAGMTTAEAFAGAARQGGPRLQEIANEVYGMVAAGVPLSQALAPYAEELPDVLLPILAAGEANSDLTGAARRLADLFHDGVEIGHRFEYSSLGAKTAVSSLVSGRNINSVEWSPGRRMSAQRANPVRDGLSRIVPLLKLINQCTSTACWTRTLASLWKSGVPISSALEVAARTAGNAHAAQALRQAAVRTREGQSLRTSLADAKMLPEYLLDMVETGELTGNFDFCLEELAYELEEDARKYAAQLVVLLIWGTLLLVAGCSVIYAFVWAIRLHGWG